MSVLLVLVGLAALDSYIFGTAMPRVIADLGGFDRYASVTTGYLLTSTLAIAVTGKMSEHYGRKPFLLAGVAAFVVGSSIGSLTATMNQLVVARAVQGLGAGLIQVMTLTTVADLFPPAQRARASAFFAAVLATTSIAGPVVGGWLADGPGWRWGFTLNVPLGIAALVFLVTMFPNVVPDRRAHARVDWKGALTLTAAIVPLLVALQRGGTVVPWFSAELILLFTVAVAMSVGFFAVERRTRDPIIGLDLLQQRAVWSPIASAACLTVGQVGTLMVLPLFLQGVVGVSVRISGAAMIPMMGMLVAANFMAGQTISKFGRLRPVAVAGTCTVAVAGGLFANMTAQTAYSTTVINMLIFGLGFGLTMPVFSVAVQNAVPVTHIGVATSSIQFLRAIAGTVAAAVFGALLTHASIAGRSVEQLLASRSHNSVSADTARLMLAASVHQVLLGVAIASISATAFALVLPERPLRKSNAAPRK